MSKLSNAKITIESQGRMSNNKGWRVKCTNGAIVNLYDSGIPVVQGKSVDEVNGALGLSHTPTEKITPGIEPNQNIFVVYGHDQNLRDSLEAMLRRWNLKPQILDELPSEGATVIEKLERYTDDDIKYAVVLATPDDEGREFNSEDDLKRRTRQNVVLELGILLAKLGRKRVAILLKEVEKMEKPSDISGLIYLPFTKSLNEIKVDLAKEMKKQGIDIDVGNL